jgi:hypothetical protein
VVQDLVVVKVELVDQVEIGVKMDQILVQQEMEVLLVVQLVVMVTVLLAIMELLSEDLYNTD